MLDSRKYYVVWVGRQTGVFGTWAQCKASTTGFVGAKFKSFTSEAEANQAFADGWQKHVHPRPATLKREAELIDAQNNKPEELAVAVDAACSGNPGVMEYQGVDLNFKQQIFHGGPFPQGTNNIGEFLAIVHALSLLKQRNCPYIIYSDSEIAIGWVKNKKCKSALKVNEKNQELFNIVKRAEDWLQNNTYTTEIRKWHTKVWGEIPADFGRKGYKRH